jgi:acetyltransferase-like isoleucine patch superfamily enzyme
MHNSGKLHVGKGVLIRSFKWNPVEISIAKGAEIIIADNAFINQGVRMVASNTIYIGKNVQIGDESILMGNDFHATSAKTAVKTGNIIIDDGAWLATRVIVLRGCRVGKNAVVGANSVVTKNIPDNVFAAGIPAQIIKTL